MSVVNQMGDNRLAPGETLQSLQAGRAIAALAVVVHHSALAAATFGTPFRGQKVLEQGYLGVDFFFVLSGFIIYHSTVDRGRNWRQYFRARAIRVYAPYLPIGIGIALLYTLFPSTSAGSHQWEWLPTLTLFPVQASPALSVAWTLQFEILFYAMFGLAYFMGCLRPVFFLWGIGLAFVAITGGAQLKLLAPINAEFLMGVVVAALARRGIGSPWLFAIAVAPIVLWFLLGAERNHSVLIGLAVAFAMLPTVRLEHAGKLRVAPVLVFLGGASYSLYLAHGIAISLAMRLISTTDVILLLSLAAVAGVVGGLTYYIIFEKPMISFLKRLTAMSHVSASTGRISQ